MTNLNEFSSSGRVYKPRPGVRIGKKDAQNIGEGLTELQKQQGKLTPTIVLNAAESHKAHRLHRYFEWDNKKAARAHRVNQARQLIRATEIEVTYTTKSGEEVAKDLPSFIGVAVSSTGKKLKHVEYYDIETVAHNKNYRDDVVGNARRDAKNWLQRYLKYRSLLGDEFDDVFSALSEVA